MPCRSVAPFSRHERQAYAAEHTPETTIETLAPAGIIRRQGTGLRWCVIAGGCIAHLMASSAVLAAANSCCLAALTFG